jgi:DNA-binding GntR family transcriptional regulator
MPLEIRTLADRVHEILRERIVGRDIPPGAPIRQDVIAADLGVSKIPVREALARLEQSGLVTTSPNKGAVAAPLSMKEAEDIFATRLLIEPPTAALACGQAKAEDFQALERAVARVAEAGGELAASAATRLGVLLALLKPAGRPTIDGMVLSLYFRAERYVPRRSSLDLDLPGLDELAAAWKEGRADDVEDLYARRLRGRWAVCVGEFNSQNREP